MTCTWILLTYNRASKLVESFRHNKRIAGSNWDQIVWVDNGSDPEMRKIMDDEIDADVKIFHKTNLGVAKGFNAGLVHCKTDYIFITGSDMLMPYDWLAKFKEYHRRIPQTGVSSIYCHPLDKVPERIRGERQIINGLPIVPAMPIERRMFRRELLSEFGYFNENFGMYGYDDLAWSGTAERVCNQKNLLTYVIPDIQAIHLGTEGVQAYRDGGDDKDYHAMKAREASDPKKGELLAKLADQNYPKFTPFL